MSSKSVRRIAKDIKIYHSSDLNSHGIYIHFNEKNMYNAKALIIGPKESPYQNGFYFFDINYPHDYPQSPPNVILCTLNKKTRFNPNLYTTGKVCLSILGTWAGPGWTPCLSTNEVLLSIQSLLNNNPIVNEPGYEKLTLETDSQARTYVNLLEYHNLEIAITQMLNYIPPSFESFKELIQYKFLEFYDENVKFIKSRLNSEIINTKQYLRMYNILDYMYYQNILKEFDRLYCVIGPLKPHLENKLGLTSSTDANAGAAATGGAAAATGCANVTKDSSKSTMLDKLSKIGSIVKKKRVPNTPAAECAVGEIKTSENDNKNYIVKEVKGRGNTVHKRWIQCK